MFDRYFADFSMNLNECIMHVLNHFVNYYRRRYYPKKVCESNPSVMAITDGLPIELAVGVAQFSSSECSHEFTYGILIKNRPLSPMTLAHDK